MKKLHVFGVIIISIVVLFSACKQHCPPDAITAADYAEMPPCTEGQVSYEQIVPLCYNGWNEPVAYPEGVTCYVINSSKEFIERFGCSPEYASVFYTYPQQVYPIDFTQKTLVEIKYTGIMGSLMMSGVSTDCKITTVSLICVGDFMPPTPGPSMGTAHVFLLLDKIYMPVKGEVSTFFTY